MATVRNKWTLRGESERHYHADNAFMWVFVDQIEDGYEWTASFNGDHGCQVQGTAENMAVAINAAKAEADKMLQKEIWIDL